jgi:antitoxin component YwqK of YwqJK toxin-antitoxin module
MSAQTHPDGNRWRQRVVIFFGALLVGVIAFWLIERPAPHRAAAIEKNRNELEFRDGRFLDGTNFFTGTVVEFYAPGQLKSRSNILNGLAEGLSQGWFTNGVLQVTESFTHGVSNGERIKFYESGQKLSVACIVDGQLQGRYQRWHDNGHLAEQVNLTNGVASGEALAYYADGSLKSRVLLADGKVIQSQFLDHADFSRH